MRAHQPAGAENSIVRRFAGRCQLGYTRPGSANRTAGGTAAWIAKKSLRIASSLYDGSSTAKWRGSATDKSSPNNVELLGGVSEIAFGAPQLSICTRDVMVAVTDLKSVGRKAVPVRVRAWALWGAESVGYYSMHHNLMPLPVPLRPHQPPVPALAFLPDSPRSLPRSLSVSHSDSIRK